MRSIANYTVTPEYGRCSTCGTQVFKERLKSAVALARLLYYDSVLERAIVHHFFKLQDTELEPKNMMKPLVDPQSSGFSAPSALRIHEEKRVVQVK